MESYITYPIITEEGDSTESRDSGGNVSGSIVTSAQEVTVKRYTGTEIPGTFDIEGNVYTIMGIRDSAFSKNKKLVHIVISDSRDTWEKVPSRVEMD